MRQSPEALCTLEDQILHLCSSSKSRMIFTAGVPGAGKTFVLHQLRALGNVTVLDLDNAIMEHPSFNPANPASVYDDTLAYEWANEQVERMFDRVLDNVQKHRLVAFDGTGTKVGRSVRRMQAAKSAGFGVVLLYVKVQLSTALARNEKRHRRVPEETMRQYLAALDEAVERERKAADEYIEFDVSLAAAIRNHRSHTICAQNDKNFEELAGPGLKLWQSIADRRWGPRVVYDEVCSLLGPEQARLCLEPEAPVIDLPAARQRQEGRGCAEGEGPGKCGGSD
eukprot:g2473.t1